MVVSNYNTLVMGQETIHEMIPYRRERERERKRMRTLLLDSGIPGGINANAAIRGPW
jgi:hypothetical protein